MKQKNAFIRGITPLLETEYGWARTEMILDYAQNHLDKLCSDGAEEPSAVKTHTVGKLYPAISVYRALQRAGVSQPDALAFLDRSCSEMAQKQADSMRTMCKIPGFPRLMPKIFRFVTKSTFGEKAGFAATFYPTEKTRCKFDMTKCLYCDVCRRNGCPELTVCFCHTDDVTDGNMHPRLLWNRTKIMGDGADCCDFDLIYLEDGKTAADYQAPQSTEE